MVKMNVLCVIRGDMKSLNTAMRDPTLFRIIKGYHPKLNNKYSCMAYL